MKAQKIKLKLTLPNVIKNMTENRTVEEFPLNHYSYSTLSQFSTNPFMFKIKYINGDRIDSTSKISGVVGSAFHRAMEAFYGSEVEDNVKEGLEAGIQYLEEYNEGFIEYSKTIPNKAKALEVFTFAYNSYLQESKPEKRKILALEEMIEASIDVQWKGELIDLPVPLKGYLDRVDEREIKGEKEISVIDYKTTQKFSDPDKIDGRKILQSVEYYFLAHSKYGKAPYSMIFEEVKITKNKDGSPQVRRYEIIYRDNEQFFDFYFRFYEDITRSLNGEAVYVPNINDFFDNEVAIIAYIHRLDVTEEKARQMKKFRVDNITSLLKKKIEHAGSMRKLMKTAERKFKEAKNINYSTMQIHEKIQTKLMEFGILVHFENKIEGFSVDLYRYRPSIGLKMSKLIGYLADIEQVVGISGIRILAPIPNTTLVGFEIPRTERKFPGELPMPKDLDLNIGVDIMGNTKTFDIREAPHMLVAGATKSGKSVFLNAILTQLCTLDNVELHLFDPKMVELSRFAKEKNTIEYYCDIQDIYLALGEIVNVMNARYQKLSKAGVRNLEEYNKKNDQKIPYKFVVIDEFGDLTVSNYVLEETVPTGEVYSRGVKAGTEKTKKQKLNLSQEVMKSILLLAQKARAAGIHMIIATQRPSTDIITGSIKANFPTKVAFRTAKITDSKVLLDESGAEKLLGKGDMIFSSDEGMVRLQGFYC